MIKQTIKLSVATIASVGLMGGMAFASPSISNTGKNSVNVIKSANISVCKQVNKNNVGVSNASIQGANTGNAKVKGNTTGGSANSGGATNSNSNTVDLTATNNSSDSCSCGCNGSAPDGSIDTTGNNSVNVIKGFNLNVQKTINVNNVGVDNSTLQGASSGNATVSGNTTGGSATSGDASNTNTNDVTVTVSNN